ncbi:hypothetical protein HanXRQr2_Chr09g0387861 [Helianthus annuus]|uniref:Uncharacterized protein n=1 Tax=Helianthus annuus TaxID=4232 RepID=A0A9K3I6A8_HELAN|nr:hypothetical protein HanXRQr2_Chr09g0387861 [Helianthus annuus]KAJ0893103.1 hypothetical protein HanPSC8_Chr09g0373751 [Helianthus annuus]
MYPPRTSSLGRVSAAGKVLNLLSAALLLLLLSLLLLLLLLVLRSLLRLFPGYFPLIKFSITLLFPF